MAGYLQGICAEGVVVLVLSEVGNDEVEMDGRCFVGERGIGVDDGGMGMGKCFLTWYLRISYDGLREVDIVQENHYE